MIEQEIIKDPKNVEWEVENDSIKFILTNGISKYIERNGIDIEDGMDKKNAMRILVCADDRVSSEGEIAIIGSGILMEKEILKQIIKKYEIRVITMHKNCGVINSGDSQETADQKSIKYALSVGKELIEEGYPISFEYFDEIEPADYHNARAIYLNNVKGFNPTKIKAMLRGFLIEKFIDIDVEGNSKKELELITKIAFSEAGFGERFTEEKPFIIVCCLNENDNFEEIKQEINGVLDKIKLENKIENIKERTKIDYFIAPAK
mgnify:CR=1 FL=1